MDHEQRLEVAKEYFALRDSMRHITNESIVKNKNAVYLGMTHAPDLATFNGFFAFITDKWLCGTEYHIITGRGLLSQIERAFTQGGGRLICNTDGPAYDDTYTVICKGLKLHISMFGCFNDRELFPEQTTIESLKNFNRISYSGIVVKKEDIPKAKDFPHGFVREDGDYSKMGLCELLV